MRNALFRIVSIAALLAGCVPDDEDKDGISDPSESDLALRFQPFFVFDSDENASLANEPVVLYQAHAVRAGHSLSGGTSWGPDHWPTDLAFGDVDGDGVEELIVCRNSGGSTDRIYIVDDRAAGYATLGRIGGGGGGGGAWASSTRGVAVAAGDFDADDRDEIVVVRTATGWPRLFVYDDAQANFALLFRWGSDWGDAHQPVGVATGDVDADGKDEIALVRNAGSSSRYFVLDDARAGFQTLLSGGRDWGDGYRGTAIAAGDVDGDGLAEIVVGRNASQGRMRFHVLDDAQAGFRGLHSGGLTWGDGYYPIALAVGNVDDDRAGELGVARYAAGGPRFWVHDDAGAGFAPLLAAGEDWGDSNYPTDIAFGDIDGDGRDEVAIARRAESNMRYAILDDARAGFTGLLTGGGRWSAGATAIAMGQVDVDLPEELAVGRVESDGDAPRYHVFDDHYEEAPARVRIVYGLLWQRDGGYGESSWCGDAHNGDNQSVSVEIEKDAGGAYRLVWVKSGQFTWPTTHPTIEWADDAGRRIRAAAPDGAHTHPVIYLAAGKHHQYFDTSYNGEDSPYSEWGCNDDVNGLGIAKFGTITNDRLGHNNVGEFRFHSPDRFVGDLAIFGYEGENAWYGSRFLGGLDADTDLTSLVADLWEW